MIPPSNCPWCGEFTHYNFVRGHYVCLRCNRPVSDCCDGETATNQKQSNSQGDTVNNSSCNS